MRRIRVRWENEKAPVHHLQAVPPDLWNRLMAAQEQVSHYPIDIGHGMEVIRMEYELGDLVFVIRKTAS